MGKESTGSEDKAHKRPVSLIISTALSVVQDPMYMTPRIQTLGNYVILSTLKLELECFRWSFRKVFLLHICQFWCIGKDWPLDAFATTRPFEMVPGPQCSSLM